MNTNRTLALLSSSLLALFLGEPPTTDTLLIGGAGSASSEGHDDPGQLSDGETEASATFDFTFDPALARLTLEVTNTSPVVLGQPNPLLTRVYFNAPEAITGMSLVGQSSAGGLTPDYELVFDAAPGEGSDPNSVGRFGAFGVCLTDSGSIKGAIANPDADTYTVDADQVALSPSTFVMQLKGDLAGLSAESFTSLFSSIPPGSLPSRGAAKFQAGGDEDASGFINEGGGPCANEGTSTVLGSPCGGTLAVTAPVPGGTSTVSYDGSTPGGLLHVLYSTPGGTPFPFKGCTIFVRPQVRLLGIFPTDADGDFQQTFDVPTTHECGDQVVFQAVVFAGPEGAGRLEISNGVLVTMGN
jgi:hypothetical protein